MSLMVLATPAELANNVRPISLASDDTGMTNCYIVGWGRLLGMFVTITGKVWTYSDLQFA